MDVAIVGASGDCGRAVAAGVLAQRLLEPSERLQLVGRRGGASGRTLHGLEADLFDAHAERAPQIDIALDPTEVVADVVIVLAGTTVPSEPGVPMSRDALAEANLPVFEAYADAIAEHGSGEEVVLVVSNPVELGTAVFAERLGRHRVVGVGSHADTLRFRREVALDLTVRRQVVGGFVVGEHGSLMVPLWSTVTVAGLDAEESRTALARVRGERALSALPDELAANSAELEQLLVAGRIADAYAWMRTLPPDVRAVLTPMITQLSGAKTAHGTAAAVLDLLSVLVEGREAVVAAQVAFDGEVGLRGVLGWPVVLAPGGWSSPLDLELPADERAAVDDVAERIAAKVRGWRG